MLDEKLWNECGGKQFRVKLEKTLQCENFWLGSGLASVFQDQKSNGSHKEPVKQKIALKKATGPIKMLNFV